MLKQWTFRLSLCKVIAALGIGIIIAALPRGQAGAAPLAEAWKYELIHSEDGAPLRALARLRGESTSVLWLSCTRIDADDDEKSFFLTTVTVSQKQILGVSSPLGRSTVYWFDDEGPELEYWRYFRHVGQLSNPERVEHFLDKLVKSQRIIIDLSDYRYETRSVEFASDPNETRAVVERLRRDCRRI